MPQRRGKSAVIVQPTHAEAYVKEGPDPEVVRRRAIYEALGELGEVIYVIRCDDGLIKIGWTRGLRERRRSIESDFTAILAVRPGSYDDEQAIHARFRRHCARGREYYHPTPEILDFINEIRDQAGVPPLAA